MDNLYRKLGDHGIEVSAVSYLNSDLDSPDLCSALDKSDFAIINGEGTIHHGNPYAGKMLKLVANSAASKKILLNTTYDSNPSSYREYLKQFDSIFVRDRQSKAELSEIGIASSTVPDLTFLSQRETAEGKRQTVAVNCSVDRDVTIQLYKLGRKMGTTSRPLSIFHSHRHLTGRILEIRKSLAVRDLLRPVTMIRMAQARTWFGRNAHERHEQFSARLAASNSIISGRYHAICMAIKNRIPFTAIDSNTFKIRALLDDVGIDNRCYSKPDFLAATTIDIHPFTEEEIRSIDRFDQDAQQRIERMFEHIF
jgi:polysaccharide pyruvyl transferase WcaK-like protein